MQDKGKIIAGIIIFLALLCIPVMVSQASGNADYVPEPQINMDAINEFMAENYPDVTYDNECVESTEYMRVQHMTLLFKWRSWTVRDDSRGDPGAGVSYYTAADGQEWAMSLTETCLGCHTDRTVFCDLCHQYTATQPNCWDCHVDIPEGS